MQEYFKFKKLIEKTKKKMLNNSAPFSNLLLTITADPSRVILIIDEYLFGFYWREIIIRMFVNST